MRGQKETVLLSFPISHSNSNITKCNQCGGYDVQHPEETVFKIKKKSLS